MRELRARLTLDTTDTAKSVNRFKSQLLQQFGSIQRPLQNIAKVSSALDGALSLRGGVAGLKEVKFQIDRMHKPLNDLLARRAQLQKELPGQKSLSGVLTMEGM